MFLNARKILPLSLKMQGFWSKHDFTISYRRLILLTHTLKQTVNQHFCFNSNLKIQTIKEFSKKYDSY